MELHGRGVLASQATSQRRRRYLAGILLGRGVGGVVERPASRRDTPLAARLERLFQRLARVSRTRQQHYISKRGILIIPNFVASFSIIELVLCYLVFSSL